MSKKNLGVMVGGRWPSVEDDLQWKTTFIGRRPSMGRPALKNVGRSHAQMLDVYVK